jgi:hypothetical protein
LRVASIATKRLDIHKGLKSISLLMLSELMTVSHCRRTQFKPAVDNKSLLAVSLPVVASQLLFKFLHCWQEKTQRFDSL